MKIDRRRPNHWLLLMGLFLTGVAGLVCRLFVWCRHSKKVLLYGHKLNGNLLALQQAMSDPPHGLTPIFVSMDRAYCRHLRSNGVNSLWACTPHAVAALATARALVSDHGLHSLEPLQRAYRRVGLRFFDVWHGIPFKGFDANDFKLQHHYDEIWVASKLNRDLYVNRFGFKANRVIATGYPRTDRLVRAEGNTVAYRSTLGLPEYSRLILFAPTWKQGVAARSLYPFGCSEKEFLGALADVAKRNGAGVVLRSHLNTEDVKRWRYDANIHVLSASRYPDTEAILLACDMLVCDWSSIAFDYILLDRPAFFLDVEPPFAKGFSLGPAYRYGPVISSLQSLINNLEQALQETETYWQAQAVQHNALKQEVYGALADGLATKRCIERLCANLRSA